jgi:excisionase family DNA binding protein
MPRCYGGAKRDGAGRVSRPRPAQSMSAHQGLVLTLPDELVDELVERVASRLTRPTAEPWVGVDVVASHLGCRRQRIYDLVSQRGCGGGIPYRKDGSRLLFRLSEVDAWLTPPRR